MSKKPISASIFFGEAKWFSDCVLCLLCREMVQDYSSMHKSSEEDLIGHLLVFHTEAERSKFLDAYKYDDARSYREALKDGGEK